jgi:Ca2+-binding EF-hand superfamily protein
MKTFVSIGVAALAAISTQAGAQAAPDARGGWRADMTRPQAQHMADGLFQQLDLNHDGTLTRAEVEQARAQMGGGAAAAGGDRATRMIARVFGDAQAVTLAQFEAQALARFDRQDLNHDGTVTAAERQQARAARESGGN